MAILTSKRDENGHILAKNQRFQNPLSYEDILIGVQTKNRPLGRPSAERKG